AIFGDCARTTPIAVATSIGIGLPYGTLITTPIAIHASTINSATTFVRGGDAPPSPDPPRRMITGTMDAPFGPSPQACATSAAAPPPPRPARTRRLTRRRARA